MTVFNETAPNENIRFVDILMLGLDFNLNIFEYYLDTSKQPSGHINLSKHF